MRQAAVNLRLNLKLIRLPPLPARTSRAHSRLCAQVAVLAPGPDRLVGSGAAGALSGAPQLRPASHPRERSTLPADAHPGFLPRRAPETAGPGAYHAQANCVRNLLQNGRSCRGSGGNLGRWRRFRALLRRNPRHGPSYAVRADTATDRARRRLLRSLEDAVRGRMRALTERVLERNSRRRLAGVAMPAIGRLGAIATVTASVAWTRPSGHWCWRWRGRGWRTTMQASAVEERAAAGLPAPEPACRAGDRRGLPRGRQHPGGC
jgi:hypothetical protein